MKMLKNVRFIMSIFAMCLQAGRKKGFFLIKELFCFYTKFQKEIQKIII